MSKLKIVPKFIKGIKCPQRRSGGTFIKGQNSKENHPNWKGGNPKCIDCGNKLSYRRGIRCQRCYIIYMKKHPITLGKKQSELTKEKLRKLNIGKIIPLEVRSKISESMKGEKNHNYRKKMPDEQRAKLSKNYVYHTNSGCFKKGQFLGINHHNWKGGITEIRNGIRSLPEYKDWKIRIFKRDNYTCKDCNDRKGGNLEAHHIKTFEKILTEFLQEYNQFSIIDDSNTLIRLAVSYHQFWDLDNGITLCKECHKEKISCRN